MSSWTDEERDTLILLTKNCVKNSKIDWDSISSQMKNRTKQQCKSYYTNIVKSQLNIEQRKNHEWTNDEFFLLVTKAMELKNSWTQIQKLYFPNLTKKQIQSQYQYIVNNFIKRYIKDYQRILVDVHEIQKIQDKYFEGGLCLICTANSVLMNFQYQEVFDTFDSINDDSIITQSYQWKTSVPIIELHMKIVKELLGDLDVSKIAVIYVKEYQRRAQNKRQNLTLQV
ncbi:Myb-like_DNA-binding domain-containing protein [Hexamita inflata]|uniref:Myb-like DNA-binding domain-containing protein n=1 Tax=Hexamita inflata TaxID=28002 RepID=A0AA86Q6R2_9EUKA|nr:Myb-like DNA-binding domain-containing protein [Hexamita inflata]CAI9953444.1 Myb-like DNA-binding domain-containing protein [Hexamita inflata]